MDEPRLRSGPTWPAPQWPAPSGPATTELAPNELALAESPFDDDDVLPVLAASKPAAQRRTAAALAAVAEDPDPGTAATVTAQTRDEYWAAQEEHARQIESQFLTQRASSGVVKGPKVVATRRRKSRKPLVLLGVLGLAAGAAAGAMLLLGGDRDPDPATTPSSVPGDRRDAPADSVTLPASAVLPTSSSGDLSASLVAVDDPFQYGLGQAPDGVRFVAVEADLTNVGEGLVEIDAPMAAALRDAAGELWPLAPAPIDGLGEAIPVLGPGMTVHSTLVFSVGEHATELELVISVPGADEPLVLRLG